MKEEFLDFNSTLHQHWLYFIPVSYTHLDVYKRQASDVVNEVETELDLSLIHI